ncbi:hypothetical protein BIV57_04625 [Mangrovactinospora gilvigrisea]|uniref:ABC-2 type transporter transmembrane domain-containing protein n=1 Tax=Mangrovactinospora gilvigrisea TaxID=1428644 RepID=A0A1J7BJ21_9ACTN|nr:ABC transporter permease [Mangrovactinospora gilvigrisea]OIV38675.1 hypothetical protein BIV57_04625 [Mangrovactinospora gilvigrisea]
MSGTLAGTGRNSGTSPGTGPGTNPGTERRGGSAWRRIASVARAEVRLTLRNRSALALGALMPGVMVLAFYKAAQGAGGLVMVSGMGWVLLFSLYTGPVGTLTTRREQLVLKRMRTGELTDREVLAGTVSANALLAGLQLLVLLAAGIPMLKVAAPPAPAALLAGLVGGAALCLLLAASTSGLSKSYEATAMTTLPLFLLTMLGGGLAVPLDKFPHPVAEIAALLPLSPVLELLRIGWTGGGGMPKALLVLAVWLVLGWCAATRWFRWEPRR